MSKKNESKATLRKRAAAAHKARALANAERFFNSAITELREAGEDFMADQLERIGLASTMDAINEMLRRAARESGHQARHYREGR